MSPTPNRSDAPSTIDTETSELIRGKARQLAARLRLPSTDLPDLEQDLTLHVWARLGRYDPARQDRAVFARMLVGHAAATVFRGRERRTRRAPLSLDALLRAARASDGPDEPAEARAWPEPQQRHARALDVAAVLAALPRPLRRVADALKTRSVAGASPAAVACGRVPAAGRVADGVRGGRAGRILCAAADTSRAARVVPVGRTDWREEGRMHPDVYRYEFADAVPAEEVEATFVLSLCAVESLHGESQVRLNAGHAFDAGRRAIVIDAATPVGRDLNRVFIGFMTREFGPASFRVERVQQPPPKPQPKGSPEPVIA